MENLVELLEHTAQIVPDSTFLEFTSDTKNQTITFKQHQENSLKSAAYLESLGLKFADRILFISPKCHLQVRMFSAIWQIGAIAVPVSEALSQEELSFVIKDADPAIIFADAAYLKKVKDAAGEKKIHLFSEIAQNANIYKNTSKISLSDTTAAIIYTSGSTGSPKGVMLSHQNILMNARSSADLLPVGSTDRFLSLLPYWHSFALIAEIVMVMMTRSTTIFAKDRGDMLRNLSIYKPTIMLAVPRMLDAFQTAIRQQISSMGEEIELLFEKGLENAKTVLTESSELSLNLAQRVNREFLLTHIFSKIGDFFGGNLRFFIGGGAPLAKEYQSFFKAIGFPVYQGYGLTEASPVISCNVPTQHKLGSSGILLSWLKPFNGGDYEFLDESGNRGKEVKGELLVKGFCVMAGYWNHQDESAKTIIDGWLHTGDMGYMEEGFLYLNGRQSNLLALKGGEKVHPEHIEDLIKTHSLVKEAMVIGEQCKHIYVLLNLEENDFADSAKEMKKIVAELTKNLAPYQRPKNVLILPEFNLEDGTITPTLKIKRKKIFAQYAKEISEFLESFNETLR